MKYIVTGIISLIIGGILGACIAYFILKNQYDFELKQYETKINQKQNIAKVYTNEYYKLANVLENCKYCQTKYYVK